MALRSYVNGGPVLANYGIDNLRFLTPVYPGDELTVTLVRAAAAAHAAKAASRPVVS